MNPLSQAEIDEAQAIISKTSPGFYELKKLYGDHWTTIASPTTFGGKFKKAVKEGALINIRRDSLRGDNHNIYEVLERLS